MALNDTEHISLPDTEDETPRSPRTIRAVALLGVLPLEGSEAAIAAATPLREARLIEADDLLTDLRTNAILTEEENDTAITAPQQITHAQVHTAQVALNRLRHQITAEWWIANQHKTTQQLLDEFASETSS